MRRLPCGVSLPVSKAARKALAEAGLIQYIAGGAGHAKKTEYHFTGCEDCTEDPRLNCRVTCNKPMEEPVKKSVENVQVTADLGERKQLPNSAPYNSINTRLDKDQIRSESEEGDGNFDLLLDPEKLPIPNDGEPHGNTSGLIRNLRQMHATDKDIANLLKLSEFGKIGHPIWEAIFEAKNSNGAIKQPVRFIFSKLLPAKRKRSIMKTTTTYRIAARRMASKKTIWDRMMGFYNRMPLGVTRTKNEAKMYTAVLFAALTIVFPPCLLAVVYLISNNKGEN